MEHVPVPTTAQAVQDLRTLLDSEAWKAIKWKDRGQGFQYELSDQAMCLVTWPGREDQLVGLGGVPVAETQAPQALDGDRLTARPA